MRLKSLLCASVLCCAMGALMTTPALSAPGPKPDGFQAAIDASKQAMMTDPQVGLREAGKALKLAQAQEGPEQAQHVATAQWLQAEALIRTGHPADAQPIIAAALNTVGASILKLRGDLLMARGATNAMVGQIQHALEDFQTAHDTFRDAHEPRGQAKALQEIGSIYQDAGDYNRVLQYYAQSADAYKADPILLMTAYNNKANAYKELGRLDEALREFHLALDVATQMRSPMMEAHILTNLASSEIVAGKLAAADADIGRALQLTRQQASASEEEPYVYGVAAQAALRRGDLRQAGALLDKTFDGVDLKTSPPPFKDFHKTAYEVFSQLGDDHAALTHLQAYKRLDDEARSLAASTNAALMAARFDFANQDLKIAQLKAGQLQRDIALAKSKNAIAMVLLGGSVVVFILLLVGILSLRRSRNEVRKANVSLSSANTSLEKALKAKTEFLATTSHEIRTPLNGILGMTQVLLADRRVESEVREKISLLHGAGETMRALVDDILDVAKIETGNLTVERAETDLHVILRETALLWRDKASAKGLRFVLDVERAPVRIVEDGGRLRQVLFNLMSNAIKFTEAGEVGLSAHAEGAPGAERLVLQVTDTGIGIAADQIEEAFESFRQLDGGLTRQQGGTGLGLTICRNLAHAMGGEVTVESVVGQGSTFSVNLPLQRVGEGENAPSADAEAVQGLAASSILLIEANPLAQSMMRAVVQPQVKAFEVTASGAAGLEALALRRFDQVVAEGSALLQPDLDVLASIDRLVTAAGGAPLTVLYSQPTPEEIRAMIDHGVHQVLAKPISAADVLGHLRTLAEGGDDRGPSAAETVLVA